MFMNKNNFRKKSISTLVFSILLIVITSVIVLTVLNISNVNAIDASRENINLESRIEDEGLNFIYLAPSEKSISVKESLSKGTTDTKKVVPSDSVTRAVEDIEADEVNTIPVSTGYIPGEVDGYYRIWNLEHLAYINTNTETLNKNYMLMRDLDFNDPNSYFNPEQNMPLWTTGEGWVPIGDLETSFTGFLNGNNKTISNLYIYRPTRIEVGLFGRTYYATVTNITTQDINLTGDTEYL